ncbi:MAG: hypothetical protein QXU20_00395 [Candidatus Woesearchaeota archaeon]
MQGSLEAIIGDPGSGLTSTLREKFSPLQATNKIPYIIFVHKTTFDSANENTKKIYNDSKAKIVSSVEEIYHNLKAYKIEKNNGERISEVSQYQQIFIDGIHNFSDLNLILLLESAAYHGKRVVIAGNQTPKNSEMPYPIMPALIAKSDNVIVLSESTNPNLEIITGCMFSSKSQKLARKLNNLRSQGYNVLAFKHSLDVERFNDKKTFIRGQDDDPYGFEAYTAGNVEEIERLINKVEKLRKIDYVGIDEINFFQETELIKVVLPEIIEKGIREFYKKDSSELNIFSPYEIKDSYVFFKKPKIQSLIEKLLDKGIAVIVSGLDTDYRGEPWNWFTLFSLKSKIYKSSAQCSEEGCLNQATKTMRLTYDPNLKIYKPSHYNEEVVQVGTNIEYKAHIYTPKCREHHRVEHNKNSKLNPKEVFPF